jgi:hypothetical protein
MRLLLITTFIVSLSVPAYAGTVLKGRAETNWRLGTDRSILMTEFWVPIAQNNIDGSVIYGDLRMMGDDQNNREFNIGVGYRKMVQTVLLGDGIVGTHAWYDNILPIRGDFAINLKSFVIPCVKVGEIIITKRPNKFCVRKHFF